MTESVYLDHNATQPVCDAAFEAMLPYLRDGFGNPSSIHVPGVRAREAVEQARERIAASLACRAGEIFFTSGATESINWAIRGALAAKPERKKVVISATEHAVTRDIGARLAASGYELVVIPVDGAGRLDFEQLANVLDDDVAILSLIWVNNETGVIFDAEKIGALARERGVPFHLDAVQMVGKRANLLNDLTADMISFSGHKFGSAQGSGGLWVRRGCRLRSLIWGGHQEKTRRSGTENTPGIIGMAAALHHSIESWERDRADVARRRDELETRLVAGVDRLLINGADAPRIENTTNVCFHGIEGAAVVLTLSSRGIHASAGSACSASDPGPSEVLAAYGVPGDFIHGSLRLSLSTETTDAQLEHAAEEIIAAWRHVSRVQAL